MVPGKNWEVGSSIKSLEKRTGENLRTFLLRMSKFIKISEQGIKKVRFPRETCMYGFDKKN